MPDLITIKNLSKSITLESGVRKSIIKNLNLNILFSEQGSINSIIAPFGAGKTTLLKIICGIEKFDDGSLEINNSVSKNNPIPLITETHYSLPWFNVKENIILPLKMRNEKLSDERIDQIIGDVGLTNYEEFYPQNINSGFQFRIAIARALVLSPKIILIDDSFRHLDIDTRNEIYIVIRNIIRKYQLHIILATTNLIEAVFLSNHIFLMSKSPAEIIFGLKNENQFNDIQSMVISNQFESLSKQIQTKFQEHSGIALIHYSV